MIFKEEQLRKYAKPLSETEENQCKNAIRMVVDLNCQDICYTLRNTLLLPD